MKKKSISFFEEEKKKVTRKGCFHFIKKDTKTHREGIWVTPHMSTIADRLTSSHSSGFEC